MQIPPKVKKVWDVFTTVLVVLVVLLAIVLVGVRLLGLQVYTVLSGSMEPQYPVGSLIYVKKVDYKTLQPGDVITYKLTGQTISTHRITQVLIDEKNPQGYRFMTKGDANEDADADPVHGANIIGTPVCIIPYLGYVAYYIQRPPGLYVAIAVGALLLTALFLPDLLTETNKKREQLAEDVPPEESI